MLKALLENKLQEIGPITTPLQELVLTKMVEPIAKISGVLPPSICLIAQGEKEIYLGDTKYTYNQDQFLLGSVNIPITAELKTASPANPYYGVGIHINPVIISELLIEFDQSGESRDVQRPEGFITTSPLTDEILDPIMRLIKMIDHPLDVKILGKQLLREIYYQVLKTDAGVYLKNCAVQHAKSHQIAPIIHYMQKNLKEEISIEDLTKQGSMSSSSLHESFKKATNLPPMQYLKRLRLNHANEMLLTGSNVNEAAFSSGYNSPTQFSREFKRQYGISPSQVSKQNAS